jgi:hypothetical protein
MKTLMVSVIFVEIQTEYLQNTDLEHSSLDKPVQFLRFR